MNFKCPYCQHSSTLSNLNTRETDCILDLVSHEKRHKPVSLHFDMNGPKPSEIQTVLPEYQSVKVKWIVCPNVDCRKVSLFASTHKAYYEHVSPHSRDTVIKFSGPIKSWQLMPTTKAKSFPDYIPLPIRQDYEEAYLILELSPKASATLSRRCLQGMIRDFYGVSKNRLIDEMLAIKDKVDPQIWQAIDAVREMGNIGAHMEKDINLIIDIDPSEAKKLLTLNEFLLKEWYINRYERDRNLAEVIALNDEKQGDRKQKS